MDRKQELFYYGLSVVAAISSGAVAYSWKGSWMHGLVLGMCVLVFYVMVVSAWDLQRQSPKEKYKRYVEQLRKEEVDIDD